MSKINEQVVILGDGRPIRGRITKVSDDVFGGYHPNRINEGFVTEGYFNRKPKVGENFFVGSFYTSVVTEIIDDNTFKTRNSTYKIEYPI